MKTAKLNALICLGTIVVLAVLCLPVWATPDVFYGELVSFKGGDSLVVMDRYGQKESYTITKDTVVTSKEGGRRLDRLRPGTRLSVSAVSGRAKAVAIQEVPK